MYSQFYFYIKLHLAIQAFGDQYYCTECNHYRSRAL